MSVIFVICPPSQQVHLAPEVQGMGVSAYTLCLKKWPRHGTRVTVRAAPEFCPECLTKISERNWAFSESKITIPTKEHHG